MTTTNEIGTADLSTLSVEDAVKPAIYYAICREAEQRGVDFSLDAIPTVEGLLEAVHAARERDAIKDALVAAFDLPTYYVGTVEDMLGMPGYEVGGTLVVLAADVTVGGDAETGPSVSTIPTRWVTASPVPGNAYRVRCYVDEDKAVVETLTSGEHFAGTWPTPVAEFVLWGESKDVAATLVGILRVAGYKATTS